MQWSQCWSRLCQPHFFLVIPDIRCGISSHSMKPSPFLMRLASHHSKGHCATHNSIQQQYASSRPHGEVHPFPHSYSRPACTSQSGPYSGVGWRELCWFPPLFAPASPSSRDGRARTMGGGPVVSRDLEVVASSYGG